MKAYGLLLIVFAALADVTLHAQNSITEKSSQLQSILDETVDNKKVFGTSFCIKYKGEVWCGSSGNMENDQAYFIASTTKLFVSAITLHLVSRKQISLDDKISKYLNANIMQGLHVLKGVEYSKEITVRNLLAHTSGLPDYFEDKGANGRSLEDELLSGHDQFWTFEQAIERSKKIEPLFAPNTKNKAHYSDANFQLLGKIIENITGSAFAKNCEEIIFQPLNMTKTYIYSDIYDTMPKTLYYKQKALKIPRAMASFGADGGIVSTSQEMLTFIEAFFRGKLFPESYIDDLKVWNKILAPLQSGVGIHRFKLPKITGMPELIGHSGLSGALAYYEPKNDIFVAGTVNQIAYPSTSFTIAAKLIEATLSEKKKKKVETVSAIALGTTYSNIDNNGGNSKIGLSVGVYQEYKILKPLSFTVEIVYNQKGERSDDELANIRLHYLDFPLMARLNLLNNKLGLSSGFSSGILLGSNKEKDAFQRFESSIPFAIKYALGDFLQLSLKYHIGISDLAKNSYKNQGLKNNWFGISLLLVSP
jgi:D-alanyl-D-alanine carboxypeptidase